jgi:hypothetical protein
MEEGVSREKKYFFDFLFWTFFEIPLYLQHDFPMRQPSPNTSSA